MRGRLASVVLLTAATALAAPGTVSPVTWHGLRAYQLSDAQTTVVVVPAWGRVMAYGPTGGPNLLWQGSDTPVGGWRNRGGDKTWPAPQSAWPLYGPGWPPAPSWDEDPHRAVVLPGGRLRVVGPLWAGWGVVVTREYQFDADGRLRITQSATKTTGEPVQLSLWTVTQVNRPDRVFLPISPTSAYRGGFRWISAPDPSPKLAPVSDELLSLTPLGDKPWKIGADSPTAAIVSFHGDLALAQRAERPPGEYPDWGCPVEFYHNGDPAAPYNELELLSPLRHYRLGRTYTHTVHWSWHRLPTDAAARLALAGKLVAAVPKG